MTRAKVIEEWTRDGGVLLMGYEMYRLLSLKKSFVTGRKRKSKKPAGPIIIDLDEEDRQQELMKGVVLTGCSATELCVCVSKDYINAVLKAEVVIFQTSKRPSLSPGLMWSSVTRVTASRTATPARRRR